MTANPVGSLPSYELSASYKVLELSNFERTTRIITGLALSILSLLTLGGLLLSGAVRNHIVFCFTNTQKHERFIITEDALNQGLHDRYADIPEAKLNDAIQTDLIQLAIEANRATVKINGLEIKTNKASKTVVVQLANGEEKPILAYLDEDLKVTDKRQVLRIINALCATTEHSVFNKIRDQYGNLDYDVFVKNPLIVDKTSKIYSVTYDDSSHKVYKKMTFPLMRADTDNGTTRVIANIATEALFDIDSGTGRIDVSVQRL